jgi:predicted SPOUT superfamily RNA methylase MTH1
VAVTTEPLSSAKVKERIELYLSSPSGPSRPVIGRNLPLPLLPLNTHMLYRVPQHCHIKQGYFIDSSKHFARISRLLSLLILGINITLYVINTPKQELLVTRTSKFSSCLTVNIVSTAQNSRLILYKAIIFLRVIWITPIYNVCKNAYVVQNYVKW